MYCNAFASFEIAAIRADLIAAERKLQPPVGSASWNDCRTVDALLRDVHNVEDAQLRADMLGTAAGIVARLRAQGG